MLSKLLKLIGAQPEEESRVVLLLANGFFMGVFLATYKVAAEAIFLSTFKGDYLQEAFVAAGFLGVASTFLFARLQNIIRYSFLAIFNLLFLAAISGTIWVLFQIYTDDKYLVFAAFAFLGPITAIVLLGFWGIFNRLFNLRQAKRIIGGIDTGQLSATILAFFSIPVLVEYFEFPSENLFLISSISILVSLVFLIRLVTKHSVDKAKARTKEEIRETKFSKILKNNYVILLSVFILISITILKFVDYSFLSVVQDQFPTEGSLTSFIAAINGMIMVLSFLIQTFVNDKIIGDYGLKVSLLVMPVILLLFSFLAVIVHITGGSNVTDSSFWMFFLFISLAKLFTTSLKDALENPAFKLFFMPLDIKVRFDIQTKIEGVIAEFSGLIAGSLTLVMALAGLDLIHYSYVSIILGGLIIYVVGKLYSEYRNALKSKLAVPGADEALNRTDQSIPFILQKASRSQNTSKVINSIEVMERLEPMMLETNLAKLVKGKDEVVLRYAIKKLGYLNHLASLPLIEKYQENQPPEMAEFAHNLIGNMKQIIKLGTPEIISKLATSRKASDRVLCLRLIEAEKDEQFHSHIHSLLRDTHPLVRINALTTAAKLRDRRFWPVIIDNLSNPDYTNTAMVCLAHLGEPILRELENTFNKTGQRMKTLSRIIRIYGRIGGALATELLWKKADFPDPQISSQVFSALSQSGYQATSGYRGRIKNAIDEDISRVAWNIAAFDELPKDNLGKMVRSALVEENEVIYKHIYMLLAMIHEDLSVKLARENIESGNSEDLTYAIELLDIFIDDDLKPKLFPIVDDLPIPERIRRLQVHFPRDTFSDFEVLNQIVNRDYNKLNKWTKACAIYQLGHHKESEVSDVLISNIFNPDPLLRETAAWAIHQINPEAYEEHTRRLDPHIKRHLDDVMHRHAAMDRYALLFHKVMLLKGIKLFTGVPSEVLAKLVLLFKDVSYREGAVIIREGRYTVSSFYIIETGKVRIGDKYGQETYLGPGQFFGASLLMDPNENSYSVVALEEVRVYRIEREELYSFLSRNYQVIERLLEVERMMGKEPSLV